MYIEVQKPRMNLGDVCAEIILPENGAAEIPDTLPLPLGISSPAASGYPAFTSVPWP